MMLTTDLKNEDEMLLLGAELARFVRPGSCLYLHGLLGAGKTTFTRGFLRGLGYQQKVKSPTYTLVEPYQLEKIQINHFDLYRINDAEELAHIGIEEYFHAESICLIEWPENGDGYIQAADIICHIEFIKEGRKLSLEAKSKHGEVMLSDFNAYCQQESPFGWE